MVTARDLADGRPASGVTLVSPRGVEVVTDAAGEATLPPRALDDLRAYGNEWQALAHPPGEIAATGEVWVYRAVRVVGMVTGKDLREKRRKGKRVEFDPRRVKLSAVPASEATFDEPAPVPWNPVWLGERGLGRSENLGKPDRYGRFEVGVRRPFRRPRFLRRQSVL